MRTWPGLLGALLGTAVALRAGPCGAQDAAGAPDAVEHVRAALDDPSPRPPQAWRDLLARALALGAPAAEEARRAARRVVAWTDPDDETARRVLGHVRFERTVPASIVCRAYPYIEEIEDAVAARWVETSALSDLETAWSRTLAHARRLEVDPAFRAMDGARRALAVRPDVGALDVAIGFAPPFALFGVPPDADPLPATSDPVEQARRRAAARARCAALEPVLAERGRLLRALHDALLARFGAACDLEDLRAPWGGRDDLPPARRSFEDGYALGVLLFADRSGLEAAGFGGASVTFEGWLSRPDPETGWVVSFLKQDRESDLRTALSLGTAQLLEAWGRQTRDWGRAWQPPNPIWEGLCELWSSATVDGDGRVRFDGLSARSTAALRALLESAPANGRPRGWVPLRTLVAVPHPEDERLGATRAERLVTFRAESYALVHFLESGLVPGRREALDGLVRDLLAGTLGPAARVASFGAHLGVGSPSSWDALDLEVRTHVRRVLLPAEHAPRRDPPPLDPRGPADPSSPDPVVAAGPAALPEVVAPVGPFAADLRARRSARARGAEGAARDAAVERALAWLVAHQRPDGSFPARADGVAPGRRADDGAPYDVGVTALAALALLGAGVVDGDGPPYGPALAAALRRLALHQDGEGCVRRATNGKYVYEHALAALAFVEAYAATGRTVWRLAAQRALQFSMVARNASFGWRYGVQAGENDTAVTATMSLAFDAARRLATEAAATGRPAPFSFDPAVLEGALAWVEMATDPATGRAGYTVRGEGPSRSAPKVLSHPAERSEATTAAGVFVRAAAGRTAATDPVLARGAARCLAARPQWGAEDVGGVDAWSWWWTSVALQRTDADAARAWDASLAEVVLRTQRRDGDASTTLGSWDPVDPWGDDGGRVYTTATIALALETPWRVPAPDAPTR
ncbi:MAG: hypothetical protein IT460_14480 [Planctomycetes bacterium]|nr:hypothetical protein [Planctomycetota bacterium]